ncbi:MAG: class I SAM-dependent methyltransferase [Nitrospira sp. CG24E]|nr:MAG: class I SAM-dependent methyltransferase [Nitrospira sp. CG24E]
MKAVLQDLCPPIAWRTLQRVKVSVMARARAQGGGRTQDLDVYWDPQMAQVLETWGDGNVWDEIQFLFVNCRGRVLDIACGTGKTMAVLSAIPLIEVHGFDISDMLIRKAVDRGLSQDRLHVADATKMPYADREFDYSYSIGSLEHFSDTGIDQCVREAARVTRVASFHMMPTSRSGRDEGWLKTYQSFHNCSVKWWAERLRRGFSEVSDLPSKWSDHLSVGTWFVCRK